MKTFAHNPASRSFQSPLFLMGCCFLLSVLALCSPISASFLGIGRPHSTGAEGPDHEMKFEARQPEPMFESDGGRILQWKDPMMTHMGLLDARMVTINQQSLLLPQYANSHRLLVVLRGCAHMGLMLPMGMKANVRKIYKGEIIAIPQGMPMWMYNEGQEPCSFLTFANINGPMMHGHHMYEAFHLAGAVTEEEMGGIMHGFSKEMLMEAMDVDERIVRELMENQEGVAIVKMSQRPGHDERYYGRGDADVGGGGVMVDFGYHIDSAHRDIVSPQAGQLTVANGYKLPVLKLLGMSVGCLKLDNNALTAPGWFTNADHMIYCARGSARVQVVSPSGKMAGDVELKEGDMMMVPKTYPTMMKAGGDGFEAALIMNSHRPIAMHITGKDSVFNTMPQEVRMGTFEINRELDRQVHEESKRRHDIFLLPPRERRPRNREESSSSMDTVQEVIWNMFEDSRDFIQQVVE